MQNLLLHVLAIMSVAVVAGFAYIFYHKDSRQEFLSMFTVEDSDDDFVRKCIKDSFMMQELIMSATSSAELDSFFWEIEDMDNTYRGLVPREILRNHTDRLYDAISIRRDQIKKLIVLGSS